MRHLPANVRFLNAMNVGSSLVRRPSADEDPGDTLCGRWVPSKEDVGAAPHISHLLVLSKRCRAIALPVSPNHSAWPPNSNPR